MNSDSMRNERKINTLSAIDVRTHARELGARLALVLSFSRDRFNTLPTSNIRPNQFPVIRGQWRVRFFYRRDAVKNAPLARSLSIA